MTVTVTVTCDVMLYCYFLLFYMFYLLALSTLKPTVQVGTYLHWTLSLLYYVVRRQDTTTTGTVRIFYTTVERSTFFYSKYHTVRTVPYSSLSMYNYSRIRSRAELQRVN